MRVRNLNIYLREQRLLRQGDMSMMRGMRVGIDTIYFFRSLKGICDPLSEVGGCIPPTFSSVVEDTLDHMERLGIQPLFVFEGMQTKTNFLLSAQLVTLSVSEGWLAYSRGDIQGAISKFMQTSLMFSEDLVQVLMNSLRSKGKDTIRCPYFAGAQLSYFCSEGMIDAIIGPPSLMLFGVPRCVISVDFNRNRFEWVELKEVLARMEITSQQLIDVCLMAGTEHCLSFPSQKPFSFSNCVDMVKQGSIAKHLSQLPHREGLLEYVDGYCVTKTLVTYPLILDKGGLVRPLHKGSKVPADYHKIVGTRIPQVIYHLLGQGVISPKIPYALATGEWIDEFNLTDSIELRELLQDTREYKCRALGLAVLRLDPSYQSRPIRFQGHVAFIRGHLPIRQGSITSVPNTCSTRVLSPESIAELSQEISTQKVTRVDPEFVLTWHLRSGNKLFKEVSVANAAQSVSKMFTIPNGATKPSEQDLYNAHLWCILLENLGYFTKQGGATAFGSVLSKAKLGLTGVLFMEMLKFGMFTGEAFELPLDITIASEVISKSRGVLPQDTYQAINLVSRVACLHTATVDSSYWKGEVEYSVSNYVTHVKVIRRSINYLIEGIVILMGGLTKGGETPYLLETNCFMAIVIKWLLTVDNDENQGPADGTILDTAQTKFPNIVDMKQNLQSFANFWTKISNLLHELAKLVHIQALGTFDKGTAMLHALFERIDVTM
ncbi:hypothetical protein BgAZ_303370 [Babesia gibsoni]|uniref:XPG N-terminal domain-containing protein n=1 Tax=Babesia gibsoni TaxID=33632 RepID=A0AAD8PDI6_BABGI|nr:hypothetical protein BgAZ_303370 [Babesia gibsoni]